MTYEILAVLALSLLAQFIKTTVVKYGQWAVHVFVFIVALVVTAVWLVATSNPQFMDVLLKAGSILLTTVGLYEVILKRIGFRRTDEILKTQGLAE